MSSLQGKIAVVTGASRGIGKGCAIELASAGATVYITGRSARDQDSPWPGTVTSTAEEINSAGGQAVAVQCDHRDDQAVKHFFERVRAEQGRLDILVNNAFIIPKELVSGKPFWELPLSNWDDMIDVGTRSAYVASALAVPLMIEGNSGLIANISSSGAREYAWHVAYGVGKAALDRFTSDAAYELRDRGVAVVSLWPGLVLTERNEVAQKTVPGLDFASAESSRFTGRAVAALAGDSNFMRYTGEALTSRDLAEQYGFSDVDGRLPAGPLHSRPRSAKS